MILNVNDGTELVIHDGLLAEPLSGDTSLAGPIQAWDLDTIATITTYESLNEHAAKLREEYTERKNGNIIKGAIMGGLMDAAIGDDSIIDGIILGAAFSAVATNSAGVPKALIGVVFTDGNTLALEVDKYDYTQLQAFAQASKKKETPSQVDIPLDKGIIEIVLDERKGSRDGVGALKGFQWLMLSMLPQVVDVMSTTMIPNLGFSLPTFVSTPLVMVGVAGFIFSSLRHVFNRNDDPSAYLGPEERPVVAKVMSSTAPII